MNIRPYKKGDESQILWLINDTWKSAYSHIFPSAVFNKNTAWNTAVFLLPKIFVIVVTALLKIVKS